MKKITLLVFILVTSLTYSQANFYWSGGSTSSDNIDQGDNWFTAGNPSPGDNLHFNNTVDRNWAWSNYGTGSYFGTIITYNGAGGIRWRGDDTYANKFENLSDSNLFEIESNIGNRDSGDMELNPVGTGGIIVMNNIFINGGNIIVYGDQSLTVQGVISGSGGFNVKNNSTVIFESDNTYSGTTTLEAGTLKLQGSIVNSDVIVQSGATLEIDGALTVKSINVEAGGFVKINSGNTLTVTNPLTLNSTSILYSSLISDGSITGTVTYNRWVNVVGTIAGGGNDLVSPPVSGQNWSSFLTANGPSGDNVLANNGSGDFAFGPYVKTSNSFQNYTSGESPDPVLTSGVGYRAATTSGSTLKFTGSVLTTDQTTPISDTDSKWNLIGNPFPSYLSTDDFLTTNEALLLLDPLAVFVYGYNGNVTGSKYDLIGKADGHMLAPGQGFFVASKASSSGNVQFNTAMRSTAGGSADGNDFIANRISATENEILLEVSKSDNAFTTTINFDSNSSQGIDPGYDGAIFGDNGPEFAIYSELVQDNTGRDLAIQSLGITDMEDVTVPLGIHANQGEQLTIGIANSNLPANINVYLEDNATNTWTLLNDGDYTFTPSVDLNDTGRFFLRFSSTTLSVDDNVLSGLQMFTDQSSKSIVVKGLLQDTTSITVYDIQGREVLQQLLDSSSTTNNIDASSLSTGIYVAHLNNRTQHKTQKIILK